MLNNLQNKINEIVKQIQKEVYIKEEILKKIVVIFLTIKEGKFPGTKPPRGLLFYGPPGTGKTLLMKTLAKKLDIPNPIIIRGPAIISQYYGKSEARIRLAFSEAQERAEESGLAIIFIDEIDSLAPERNLTKGELESRLVGQLLSEMDGFKDENLKGHVIVIGSTNKPEVLDPALRRPGRFDFEIEFEPPDKDDRKKILEILLKNEFKNQNLNLNLEEIADQTIGFTGADLLHLLNESLIRAIINGRNTITQDDLLNTINDIKPSALRGYHKEIAIDKRDDIGIQEYKEKIDEIGNTFSSNPSFKAVLINSNISTLIVTKIVSSIAFLATKNNRRPYLVVTATLFKSKWFGEMERNIRELFLKIKRLQPCVVYIKFFDAVARADDEHLYGAILELLEQLSIFSENNIKVLLLCSTRFEIDQNIKNYFTEKIG
ncbi:MAG: AAA family ATPase [Promethearchaeota archaeon]